MNFFLAWIYPVIVSLIIWQITKIFDRRGKATGKVWIKTDSIKNEIYGFIGKEYMYLSTKGDASSHVKKISKLDYDSDLSQEKIGIK